MRSVLRGCGSYLPARIMTNAELAQKVDTSDEWIVQRTGIHARHIAADDETTGTLGLKAAEAALADAGIPADAELAVEEILPDSEEYKTYLLNNFQDIFLEFRVSVLKVP